MARIVTFHELWEMEGVVKKPKGVDKQHGIRSFMIGEVANRGDGKGETDFLSLSTYLEREDSWNTWIKKGFRQDASVIISRHVMRTSSVLSEPSTSVSSLVSRQALSCSPHAAHLRTEGEIGHFADHAPRAGALSEHDTGIRTGVCTVIGDVIFGSNSPSCACLSLSPPDVDVFIRLRTRIFHLCSRSW